MFTRIIIGAGDQFRPSFAVILLNNRFPACSTINRQWRRATARFRIRRNLTIPGRENGTIPARGSTAHQHNSRRVALVRCLGRVIIFSGMLLKNCLCYRALPEKYRAVLARARPSRLTDRRFTAGVYSHCRHGCLSWIVPHQRQGQHLNFPNLKR